VLIVLLPHEGKEGLRDFPDRRERVRRRLLTAKEFKRATAHGALSELRHISGDRRNRSVARVKLKHLCHPALRIGDVSDYILILVLRDIITLTSFNV
jgi:hypothetical protein